MSAEGTIFYAWTAKAEREAFELLVQSLELELDEVRPPHSSSREPVRFWVRDDLWRRTRELARFHGVAYSTIYRLLLEIGIAAVEESLLDASGEPNSVRYPIAVAEAGQ